MRNSIIDVNVKRRLMDFKKIKNDFPIFKNVPKLVYLDNSATTQKPQTVIDAISNFIQNKTQMFIADFILKVK